MAGMASLLGGDLGQVMGSMLGQSLKDVLGEENPFPVLSTVLECYQISELMGAFMNISGQLFVTKAPEVVRSVQQLASQRGEEATAR